MSQHYIMVDCERCEVTCNKTGKTVWTAIGECNGKPVEEKGQSASKALANWKSKAEMMND